MSSVVEKLNCTIDILELRQYYSDVVTDFSHLKWSWDQSETIVKQWLDAAHADPANLLTYGYAIQSNLLDLTLPCPPWNISSLPTTDYRNTVLAFGIIEKLQERFPYGYRWAISVQPPRGKVGIHSDQSDELTIWIPIYTSGPAITFVAEGRELPIKLESNGNLYLLDTTIPHYTLNTSNTERATIIFRINKKYKDDVLTVKGLI
jgi:hypothetical protein